MDQSSYRTQAPEGPLTVHAIFLVVRIVDENSSAIDTVRDVISGLEDLVKTVGFREPRIGLSCTVGIGDRVWNKLVGSRKPAELHPFREIKGAKHTAVSTPGDLLFHIRADREDLGFEFERLLLQSLGDAVVVEDEVTGFRYFDSRDLLGFVDGTANPIGPDLADSAIVGSEDPDFAGGSYLVVQKYLHDLDAWQKLRTSEQEEIIGRTKSDNIELDDAAAPDQKSHKTLATIEDDDGEHDIVRDNMPFGRPGRGEFGTYFIGYGRALWVIEKMLERMFIGEPEGKHDRILDFSTPKTGSTYFVLTQPMLADLGD
ncbi:MAG: Dyp-type peroxidase [Rhodococcus sp.]|nr:Dyp-type peroxidase [Rhodococcus sp. (in: high G+C Gram-positive bacteria)]